MFQKDHFKIKNKKTIDQYHLDDFIIENYNPYNGIYAKMSSQPLINPNILAMPLFTSSLLQETANKPSAITARINLLKYFINSFFDVEAFIKIYF